MTVRTGGCLCRAVRYRIEADVDHIDACHCGMCRKVSGGVAFGLHVPPGGIVWEKDAALRTFASSDWAERGFCSLCGSSLFWRMTSDETPMFSLAAGTLDDLAGLTLTTEIYVDRKPDGYAFAGDTKKMTEADVIAAFAPEQGDAP